MKLAAQIENSAHWLMEQIRQVSCEGKGWEYRVSTVDDREIVLVCLDDGKCARSFVTIAYGHGWTTHTTIEITNYRNIEETITRGAYVIAALLATTE
jgi:hypothetical protein